jgi:Tfp pilus assembly protein PilE
MQLFLGEELTKGGFMQSKNQKGFAVVEGVLILVVVAILGFTSWYVIKANGNAKDTLSLAAGTNVAVKSKPKKAAAKTTTTTPAAPVISASLKENTAAAITSGNTAALQGYMADSVNVVIAGSEKTGQESSAAAVKDLDYLNSGTAPWNFALDSATLTTYQNGFYKQYFGADSTIVGQAANGYVVSFGVNAAGKIDTVFMSASTDQLN